MFVILYVTKCNKTCLHNNKFVYKYNSSGLSWIPMDIFSSKFVYDNNLYVDESLTSTIFSFRLTMNFSLLKFKRKKTDAFVLKVVLNPVFQCKVCFLKRNLRFKLKIIRLRMLVPYQCLNYTNINCKWWNQ